MDERAREWRLQRRPQGWPVPDDVALVDVPMPAAGEGEVLIRNLYLSVDPYMRGRMNEGRSYAAGYELGKVMFGGAVGQVVRSRVAALPEGALVRHNSGWRTHAVLRQREAEPIGTPLAPLPAYLGALGMPSMTAWVGLYDIGEIRPGETVWVSAASGAVGSVAVQLARLAGCRVIATAGGEEKLRWLRDELHVDVAIDHRDGNLMAAMHAAAPEGIDVYFDNVGGEHLRVALSCMNPFGRLVECGMIATYNVAQPGPENLFLIVSKKLRVQGFIVSDHASRRDVFTRHVAGLLQRGLLVHRETVVEGIETMFDAFIDLLHGGRHVGKLVVRLGDPE